MSAALRLVEGSSMDKSKALDAALSQIERNFGKGSIMRLGKNDKSMDIDVVSTGSLGLDIALGVGGLPRGRVVEIYGPESSGKTTLALHCLAEAQKKGGICAFIDAEHALDPIYARKLGVNVDDLLISQPDTGEQALEIADTLVRSGAVDVLVIDSVAALVPRAELEGEMGDSQPGLQARLMSQALRKLTASINRSNTMVIFINQIRMKIGVMYGSPETTTGGHALKFYASVRLDIRRIGAIKERDEVVGNQTRVKVVKNKLAPPFKQVEFDIMYGEGISKTGELVDLGVKAGVVEKSGAWFSYDSQRIGQGRENAKAFLKANPDIAGKIEAAVRQNAGPHRGENSRRRASRERRRRRRRGIEITTTSPGAGEVSAPANRSEQGSAATMNVAAKSSSPRLFPRPRGTKSLRAAALRRPRARAGAALPMAAAAVAGKAPGPGRALVAGADGHDDGAGRRDFAADREQVRAAVRQEALRDTDRVTIAAVAVALLGDDGHAPNAVVARHGRVRGGGGGEAGGSGHERAHGEPVAKRRHSFIPQIGLTEEVRPMGSRCWRDGCPLSLLSLWAANRFDGKKFKLC